MFQKPFSYIYIGQVDIFDDNNMHSWNEPMSSFLSSAQYIHFVTKPFFESRGPKTDITTKISNSIFFYNYYFSLQAYYKIFENVKNNIQTF